MNILKTLYKSNNLLASRIHQNSWYYALLIFFGCMTIASFGLLLNSFFKRDLLELQILFNITVFLVVMLDIMAMILKFRVGALIETRHLIVYPLSKYEILYFNFVLLLTDLKSFLIITIILISSIFFIIQSHFIAVFLNISFWLILMIVNNFLMLDIYKLFGRWLNRFRDNLLFVGLLFIFILLGLSFSESELIFTKIPIISYVGNGLYGLVVSDIQMVFLNGLYLLITCIILFIIYMISPSDYNVN